MRSPVGVALDQPAACSCYICMFGSIGAAYATIPGKPDDTPFQGAGELLNQKVSHVFSPADILEGHCADGVGQGSLRDGEGRPHPQRLYTVVLLS